MKRGVCAGPACPREGQAVRLVCRGFCRTCYDRARKSGALAVLPRVWRPYTGAELALIRDGRARGVSYKEIARRLGRSLTAVRLKARGLGLWKKDGKAHGKGGRPYALQMERIAFIDRTGHYPDRFGNPGKKLPKWYAREGDGRKRRIPFSPTRADDAD